MKSVAIDLTDRRFGRRIEQGSTKPLSVAENLSLLQTITSDFRALNCRTVILANENYLYIGIHAPASIGNLSVKDGHIQINDVPVSVL